jgi:hypothetical protein
MNSCIRKQNVAQCVSANRLCSFPCHEAGRVEKLFRPMKCGESKHLYVNVNVKLSPMLNNQTQCHEDVWGGRGMTSPFFISVLD